MSNVTGKVGRDDLRVLAHTTETLSDMNGLADEIFAAWTARCDCKYDYGHGLLILADALALAFHRIVSCAMAQQPSINGASMTINGRATLMANFVARVDQAMKAVSGIHERGGRPLQ